MRVVIHLTKSYDWEPLQTGIEPTEKDKAALRVKPGSDGRWLMRITKIGDTHTTLMLTESELIRHTMFRKVRFGETMTRREALASWTRENMRHHAHPQWFKDIEIHDDGPSEELFLAYVARHTEAGHLESEDVGEMVKAYTEHATPEHLKASFKVGEP
jgi:hypothetical protein